MCDLLDLIDETEWISLTAEREKSFGQRRSNLEMGSSMLTCALKIILVLLQ